MLPDLRALQQYRNTLYGCFPKRRDAIFNLLDALSSFAHQYKSIVQLSKAPCFERQYTSITDAIADGLPHAHWSHALRCFHKAAGQNAADAPHRFLLDVTHQPRPFAKKLPDKTIVHAPNPTPGNKPIAVGHSYAVVAQLPQDSLSLNKHWVLPLAAKRVTSHEKGHEIGLQQVKTLMQELTLTDKLCISIGDSLYGTQECRRLAVAEPNLVHLFRLNSKRNVFSPPDAASSGKGRKQEYGNKMLLSDANTHPPHSSQITLPWQGKHKTGQVVITCWQNRLLRGSRKFRSALHPINVIQIRVIDENAQPLFKRPLWLAVLGQRRQELNLDTVYHSYLARYDIEHFFRFGKNKLLLDAYQTPDVSHEENWWQLVMLATSNSIWPEMPLSNALSLGRNIYHNINSKLMIAWQPRLKHKGLSKPYSIPSVRLPLIAKCAVSPQAARQDKQASHEIIVRLTLKQPLQKQCPINHPLFFQYLRLQPLTPMPKK